MATDMFADVMLATITLKNSTGTWNGPFSTWYELLEVANRLGWKGTDPALPDWIVEEGDGDDCPRTGYIVSANDARGIFEAVASACGSASTLSTDERERLL